MIISDSMFILYFLGCIIGHYIIYRLKYRNIVNYNHKKNDPKTIVIQGGSPVDVSKNEE